MCLAVPGQIQEIYESLGTRMGKVSFGGIVKEVCLAYLPEIAVGVGIVIEERSLPILPDVQSACDLLDMDLIYAPNEGKLVVIVDPRSANEVLRVMQESQYGIRAAIIGTVTEKYVGMLAARTAIGGTRVIPLQIGEQIPRIC